MPHLVILYTSNLEKQTDMDALCRKLADAMLTVRDAETKAVFPTGGVRVLAYPAPHFAVADGQRDYAFVYLNLRIGVGRSAAVHKNAGDIVLAAAKQHLAGLLASRYIGITLQMDESKQQVYDAKFGTLHPLFGRP